MALINCPECGKEISDKALSCPNCGHPSADLLKYITINNFTLHRENRKNNTSNDVDTTECDIILLSNLYKKYPYPTYAIKDFATEKGISKEDARRIVTAYYESVTSAKSHSHYPVRRIGTIMKTLFFIIIVIIFIIIIGSISENDEVKRIESNSITTESFASEPTLPENVLDSSPSSESEQADNISRSATVFGIGEIAEYKDVQVSILSCKESSGTDWAKPASGNKFVFAEIEIVNNSDEEIVISSMMSFECYCDDYKLDYSSNALMAISTADNMHQLDGNIAPGKKMKGTLGVEVPSEWKTIEIYYNDNVWLGSNFNFIISK